MKIIGRPNKKLKNYETKFNIKTYFESNELNSAVNKQIETRFVVENVYSTIRTLSEFYIHVAKIKSDNE